MGRRRKLVTVVALVTILPAGSAAWIACVGSDPVTTSSVQPDPTAADGDYRGKCNDGRCLSGLVCTQGVCLYPDYPDGGRPPDGPGTDGGGTGGDAGGPNPCPWTMQASNQIVCPPNPQCTAPSQGCCVRSSGNACEDWTMCAADGGQPVACAGKDQCPGSEKCCIDLLGAINQNACPHTLAWSDFEKTKCSPECSVNSKQLCRNDSECTTGKCRQVDVATGIGLLITLGACFQ